MGVNLDAIQGGDFITIRTRVFLDQEVLYVQDRRGTGWEVALDEIIGHEPKPRDVASGDRVTVKDGKHVYPVIAVHGGRAWLDDAGAPLRNPCRDLGELRLVK